MLAKTITLAKAVLLLLSSALVQQVAANPMAPDDSSLDLADLEAHLEVEGHLETFGEGSKGQLEDYLVETTAKLESLLLSRKMEQPGPESSLRGKIRGLSSELMSRLVEMFNELQVGEFELLMASSEQIGQRAELVGREVGIELAHLQRHLAALVHAAGNKQEANGTPPGGPELSKPKKAADEEMGWFDRLIDWISPSRQRRQTQ